MLMISLWIAAGKKNATAAMRKTGCTAHVISGMKEMMPARCALFYPHLFRVHLKILQLIGRKVCESAVFIQLSVRLPDCLWLL